jgi:hypothetical protein
MLSLEELSEEQLNELRRHVLEADDICGACDTCYERRACLAGITYEQLEKIYKDVKFDESCFFSDSKVDYEDIENPFVTHKNID